MSMTQVELQAMESIKGIHREMRKANEINWEQRRYETAKHVLPYIMKSIGSDKAATIAVKMADALIEELKRGE